MKINLNGQPFELKKEISVSLLLDQLKININYIVVEKNLIILNKNDYFHTLLLDGDSLEIIRFMGGG